MSENVIRFVVDASGLGQSAGGGASRPNPELDDFMSNGPKTTDRVPGGGGGSGGGGGGGSPWGDGERSGPQKKSDEEKWAEAAAKAASKNRWADGAAGGEAGVEQDRLKTGFERQWRTKQLRDQWMATNHPKPPKAPKSEKPPKSQSSGWSGISGSRLGRAASAFGAMHAAQQGLTAAAGGDAGGAAAGGVSSIGFGAAALTGNPLIAGLTMGFSTLTGTVSKMNEEFDKTARHLERYSGALAAGNAQADMIQMQSDMRSAERVGPELAENVVMRAKTAAAFQRIGDEIQLALIRVENAILRMLGATAKSDDNTAIDQFRMFASMRIDQHGNATHTPAGAPLKKDVMLPMRQLQNRFGGIFPGL